MDQKQLRQVDALTNECLDDGYLAVLFPKRANGFGQKWFAMAQDALTILKSLKQIEDFRMLIALLERLNYDNLIQANQSQIAHELEMDRAQVNRAVKRLVGLGALLEGPKIGVSKTYRLNPNFGWKGSAKSHHSALQDHMKAARLTVVKGGKR